MHTKWLSGLPLTLLLFSTQAHAQVDLKSPTIQFGRQLPPITDSSIDIQLVLDPKLPALPVLNPQDAPRLMIRVLSTYRGPVYQLEAINQSQADILKSVASAMGAEALVSHLLSTRIYTTRVLRALSLKELLLLAARSDGDTLTQPINENTYLFEKIYKTSTQEELDKQLKSLPAKPYIQRFTIGPLQPLKPQGPKNYWHKFPFNGEDVYVIPVHKSAN
jgi:hypothetical protein